LAERRHITFNAGKHRFAVPIEKVREVINATSVLAVPGGRKPLEGVIAYREQTVLPVFSLLGLLGDKKDETSGLIVVVDPGESPVGFRVHSLGGIMITTGAEDEVAPYEGELKGPEGAITGILKKTGGGHILLEIDRVLGT
jgi:chemotaxis signal transduction protein